MRARTAPPPKPADRHPPAPLFGDEHTPEQWEEYLDARRRGVTPDLAARGIGLTGTKMRAYIRREEWRIYEVEEAARAGDEHYAERLRSTARVLALNVEEPNSRILEVELATHVPGYEHLRRDRVKHEGHVTHGIVIDVTPERLDGLTLEQKQQLRILLAELGGDIIDAEVTELPQLPPGREGGLPLHRDGDGTLAA